MKKTRNGALGLAILWLVIALIAAGGATYAWFTFNPFTNVDPLGNTISSGETTLLIATDPNAEFDVECILPQNAAGDLEPVSTVDLNKFYTATMQNGQGISIAFREATDLAEKATIHGTIYLKSLKDGCEVYFNRAGMDFGQDAQALSALRFGMKITTNKGVETHIFTLNQMGNTQNAIGTQTVPQKGTVISAINADKSAVYVQDPAKEMTSYFAVMAGNEEPRSGVSELCVIDANEVVRVDYWLYLEGCDENCINAVQNKDVSMKLSFAGVTAEE